MAMTTPICLGVAGGQLIVGNQNYRQDLPSLVIRWGDIRIWVTDNSSTFWRLATCQVLWNAC